MGNPSQGWRAKAEPPLCHAWLQKHRYSLGRVWAVEGMVCRQRKLLVRGGWGGEKQVAPGEPA